MTKIEEIINKELSSASEITILYYLMEKGIENVKSITEEDIETIEGNPIATKEYLQAIVRAAVQIAKECSTNDIFKYIRCEACFAPRIKEIEVGKYGMSDYGWEYLCNEMDIDPEETDYIKLKYIAEETNYEKY